MKSMCIHINPKSTVDEAWVELEALGAHILYSSEDENGLKVIYANMDDAADLKTCQHILSTTPFTLPEIDWVQQYKDHGLNYHDGYVHVDLKEFDCLNPKFNPIKIEPGPGFGDLSHKTTNLVLKLMSQVVKNQHVLDIGSGSGVLSLAAVSMGSLSCFGIDIDEDAIQHSRLNSKLNQMDDFVSFGKAEDFEPLNSQMPLVILMNMIQSEQVQAWDSVKKIHHLKGDCLVSGILKKDKKKYLKWAKSQNWKLISEVEEEGWLGFHFMRL